MKSWLSLFLDMEVLSTLMGFSMLGRALLVMGSGVLVLLGQG